MSTPDFDRRRQLLTRRLEEQIKTYNANLTKQNVSIVFFLLVVLPLTLGTIFFLFGVIINNAANATDSGSIVQLKDAIISFLTTNKIVHMALAGIIIIFLAGMFHYNSLVSIDLTQTEQALAGFILSKTRKNSVITYGAIHKEIEFRNLTYKQFDKVTMALNYLKHIKIEERDTIENKIIIRESDW